MKICVCGWYLEQFDNAYQVLHRVHAKYPVHVVSNRPSDYLETMGLPYTVRENTGLEWGAYNHYLMHIWDGESNVLFMHDDVSFSPFVKNNTEVMPPELMFDNVASLDGVTDQCYIFSSRAEDVENYSRHGRMVWMSKVFLAKCQDMAGFWFDGKNAGYTDGTKPELRAEMGCLGYNAGILAFHNQAHMIGGNVHRRAYIPNFTFSKRGKANLESVQYTKWVDDILKAAAAAVDKLHLGCGSNYFDGFINYDLYGDKADIKGDVRSLPFPDCSFDWIESHHLIEHLCKEDAEKSLVEWLRVLRPGGRMFLSCPDIMSLLIALKDSVENVDLWSAFAKAIYGTDSPGMSHKYGYSRTALEAAMSAAGYVDVEVKSVVGYRPTPSLLGIARKE